jgi:proteic killer suppression protein
MIKSFKSKALQRFWWKGEARRIAPHHVAKLRRQLATLDAATSPEAMNVPGWRWHRLMGDQAGRYAVWVDQNWRLTFTWSEDGRGAVGVDYEDYH